MNLIELSPLIRPANSTIRVPGSKSHTNRALIMAALTPGAVRLNNPLYCEDTLAMIDCLQALGIEIETQADHITVHGDISCVQDREYHLFAKESGTSLRFLLALLCLIPGVKTIQGSSRLNERPIQDLVDGLRQLGAQIDYCNQEHQLPVKISSSQLSGESLLLKSDVSSQFCSALLLISPLLPNGLTIRSKEGFFISKPYIDMTIHCMQEWGVHVAELPNEGYWIAKQQKYQKKETLIEGDFSSASYFFAIASLTESTIKVDNLNPHSKQPDRQFLHLLEENGNRVVRAPTSLQIEGKRIAAAHFSMEGCPDQIMTMALLAAFSPGTTTISGIRSLRVKESNRVTAIRQELLKMKIPVEETLDTLTIHGGSPQPAAIDTHNDHRIAMAFAVAGTYLPGMVIGHPEVVNKTFPTFWNCLRSLQ